MKKNKKEENQNLLNFDFSVDNDNDEVYQVLKIKEERFLYLDDIISKLTVHLMNSGKSFSMAKVLIYLKPFCISQDELIMVGLIIGKIDQNEFLRQLYYEKGKEKDFTNLN